MKRPAGLPGWLFLNWATPVTILSKRGTSRQEADGCIIYAPGFEQYFAATDEAVVEHFVYFNGPDVEGTLSALALPANTILRPRQTGFVLPLVRDIGLETGRKAPHSEQLVVLQLTELLLRLARNLGPELADPALTPLKAQHRERLEDVRSKVHGAIVQPWTVAEMAGLAHLSPPRFHALYREFFDRSPVDDLIRARLDRACWLLTNTAMSVAEVAERSGFQNVYYFSQIFRKRIGCPPSRYYSTFVAPG